MSSSASLSQLLDQAVETMRPLRRVTTRRRLRNAEYREQVLAELAVALVDDSRAVEILGKEVCEKFLDGSLTFETAFFQVDNIDNLERILKIIVEYLPQILSIVLKLFATVLLMFAISLATPSTANAQHWSYPGSIESHLQFDHGVSTAGMTREQMLSTHDRLHESVRQRSSRSFQPVRRLARVFRR